jgi:DNA-binding response OmpR family regulator
MRGVANWEGELPAAMASMASRDQGDARRPSAEPGSLALDAAGEQGQALARVLSRDTKAAAMLLAGLAGLLDKLAAQDAGSDGSAAGGLDLGAVLERIATMPRQPAPAASEAKHPEQVRFGRFTLDLAAHRLTAEDGTPVALTSMEFDLLKALATHPNKTLSRDRLLDLAHGRAWDAFDRSIDVRIARLRRKIEADPARPRFIRTVRSVGYKFVPAG